MNYNQRQATSCQEMAAACYRLANRWRSHGNMYPAIVIHYQKFAREYARLARKHMNVE